MSDHTQRAHSEHGASSCFRWWNCPGSVALARGFANTDNAHSRRGTAAHELAEDCLRTHSSAAGYVGTRAFNGLPVDDAMAIGVQVYVDECSELIGDADEYGIEEQFDLSPFGAPAPMFGTCDFWCYERAAKRVRIRDYKNGVQVVPATTPQLLYYALGAVGKLLLRGLEVETIEVGIVQPNAFGAEPVRTHTYTAQELGAWARELFDHARATLAPDAPLVAGNWCKYCPVSGNCRAEADAALAVAQVEFADVVASDATSVAVVPLEVRLMTPAEKSALLHKLDMFEQWAKQARACALAELQAAPDAIPGWKLVAPGPGRTVWRDERDAAVRLMVRHDMAEDEVYGPRPLVSPAQARGALAQRLYDEAKAAGAKLTKKAAEAAAKAALEPLTDTPPSGSGPSLVPESDPRPALGVTSDFDTVPSLTINH